MGRKLRISSHVILEGDISLSGERVLYNTYTGARLKVTQEVIQILEQFREESEPRSAAHHLGLSRAGEIGKFSKFVQGLLKATMLSEVGLEEVGNERAFRQHLAKNPLVMGRHSFAGCPAKRMDETKEKDIVFLGVPLDTATTVHPGTRYGPDMLREKSLDHITYERDIFSSANRGWFNADFGRMVFAKNDMVDIGNIVVRPNDDLEAVFGRISKCIRTLVKHSSLTVTLGGDHSISAPLIKVHAESCPELTVIHLDAHTDLAPWMEGQPHHHGSFMYRVLAENKKVQVYHLGGRGFCGEGSREKRYQSFSQRELDAMSEKGGWQSRFPLGKSCYITLDLDVLDPAFAPGVGTPVPFGMQPRMLLSILEFITSRNNIVGIDIVELCPRNDKSGMTTNLAFHLLMNLMVWAWDK